MAITQNKERTMENKQQFLHIRVDKKIKKIVIDNARKLGLTTSAYVRMILLKTEKEQ